MANHASALRKHRHDERRRLINKMNVTRMRNAIKKLRKALNNNEKENIPQLLNQAISIIDKTSKKGAIHRRTGDRYKSRIYQLVNARGQ